MKRNKTARRRLSPEISIKTLRVMKTALALLFAGAFELMASSALAQSETVTLEGENISIRNVLVAIENQSDYSFFYNDGLIDVERTVSLSEKNTMVSDVLDGLFAGSGVSYRMNGNDIILTNQEEQNSVKNSDKKISVTGQVTDDNGMGLPGVTIYEKGNTSNGVISDLDGNYTISTSPSAVLMFSFIGFTTQEVNVEGRNSVNISLNEDAIALDEVVAIGYGVQKRSSVTGSISSVKAKDLPKSATASVGNMLSGKSSGVQVLQSSAQPGGGVNIVIRGAGSDKAGNEPLYVIDGFPINNSSVEPDTEEGDFSVGKRNPLNSINPGDIESIEILKDAASTAIYGARAANGVILITTKRGQEGRTSVDVSYTHSVQQMTNYFDILNAGEFMEYRNIFGKEQYLIDRNQAPYGLLPQDLSGYTPFYTQAQIDGVGAGTDWWDEVTRLGRVHDASLSISGGNSKTNFLFSAGYFEQEGVVENSDFMRFSSRLNLDHKITDDLKIGVSATGSYIDNGNAAMGGRLETSGVLMSALQMSPLVPVFDESGNYAKNLDDPLLPNPVSFSEISDNTVEKRLLANAYVQYSPIKGLTLKTNVGMDNKSGLRSGYWPTSFLRGAAVGGRAGKKLTNNLDLLFNATAHYTTTIQNDHTIGALIGYEYQEFSYDGFNAMANDFYTDEFESNNLGAGKGIPTVNSHKYINALASYFMRLSYNYREKYIAGITLRRDGSTNFGAGNKWGFFPSVALAWRINQEDFMQAIDFISNLKLRTSYGQTGNSGLGDRALIYYAPAQFDYMFGDAIVKPVEMSQMGNRHLKWETTTEFNVGLDYGFINNRISGTMEYYNKVVSDLLSTRTLPVTSPVRNIADNIGATQLSGFEFGLNTINIDREFTWRTDLNFSTYKNKWKERNPDIALDPWVGVNDPIRSLYGYKTAGIVQERSSIDHMEGERPGNLILQDLNSFDDNHQLTGEKDKEINDADKVFLGSTDPGFSFGIGNTFEYKGFDLNIFFYGMADRILMNNNRSTFFLAANRLVNTGTNMMTDIKNMWTSENPSTTMPGIAPQAYEGTTDFLIEDASFIRLKNVTLGYTIPEEVLRNKMKMRVFVDGQNLLLLTKYTGVDPEYDSLGAYPNAMTFSAGINITF